VRDLKTAYLDSADVPVMIVSGRTDPSASWPAVRTLADRLAAHLIDPVGFGHFCQVEQPTRLARIARDFFSDTRISSAAAATFEQVGS
jgi:pimeloyl-ACP methyl ester carboxylesterase